MRPHDGLCCNHPLLPLNSIARIAIRGKRQANCTGIYQMNPIPSPLHWKVYIQELFMACDANLRMLWGIRTYNGEEMEWVHLVNPVQLACLLPESLCVLCCFRGNKG